MKFPPFEWKRIGFGSVKSDPAFSAVIYAGTYPFEREPAMREKSEAVEVQCPKCRHTLIIYIPKEEIPRCPSCGTRMVIKELLDEGKSF
jgi:ribosomal protein S27E